MADLVKIAEQFADIWECEIDHPKFQDTVGDIVKKVVYMMEQEQEQERRWIPVSERPPEDGSDILVYCDDGEESRIVACYYDNGVWFDCVFNTVMVFKNITHWMPLPQPPKRR